MNVTSFLIPELSYCCTIHMQLKFSCQVPVHRMNTDMTLQWSEIISCWKPAERSCSVKQVAVVPTEREKQCKYCIRNTCEWVLHSADSRQQAVSLCTYCSHGFHFTTTRAGWYCASLSSDARTRKANSWCWIWKKEQKAVTPVTCLVAYNEASHNKPFSDSVWWM
jgi:hypothetical protein